MELVPPVIAGLLGPEVVALPFVVCDVVAAGIEGMFASCLLIFQLMKTAKKTKKTHNNIR